MIILKIMVCLACGWLFWAGGNFQHNYRRFVMPLLLTAFCFLLTNFDLFSLTQILTIGVFCLGYGEQSPLRKCFGNGWGRGVWGLLAGITLSTGIFLSHHTYLGLYFAYLTLSFTLENALKDINQNLGDPIIGMAFGSIVFLIH